MSTALNLIIARGFDSPIQGALNSYNNQRLAQEGIESSNIDQQGARQSQQWQGEDRARAEQVAQQGRERQAALQELYGRAEQLASLDPNDPQVQAQWRQIAIEKERITGEGSAFQDIMRPKSSASPARPVIVQGPDGPVYADAASAVGKPAYIAPKSALPVIQPSYTLVPVQNPDGTVSQMMVNSKNPDDRAAIGKAPAKQNTKASDAQTSQRTFNAFDKAIGNVESSFMKTDTGPIVGRMPAYTANQQIAEGAVAAMAPILKQLFRSAGEGVFTDKDQALLLDMAPKRTDRPEAAASKIQAIRDIVSAKLGINGQPEQPVQGASAPLKSFTTKGGAKVEILD